VGPLYGLLTASGRLLGVPSWDFARGPGHDLAASPIARPCGVTTREALAGRRLLPEKHIALPAVTLTGANLNDARTEGANKRVPGGTRSSYTIGMKTAVSIPDGIFDRAERLAAQERRSRSEVYATALDEYLARHERDEVTDAMNHACDRVGETDDAFLAVAGRQALDRVEW